MIIEYKIPFSNYRKVARIYCKIVQYVYSQFATRKVLKHLDEKAIDYRDIPVIINNYNRINHLTKLVNWLENAEMRNIFIIDNASTYPLLLDYYSQTKHNVIRLSVNIGYKALWDTTIHLWFKGLPYIYTDPDILPIEECPLDAIKHFQEILDKYVHINKVGFGLHIEDIPDHYANKSDVLKWEMKFWENPISEHLYKADIDTTFALYRAHSVKQQWGKTFRTGGKYQSRHMPWYENPELLSEEELFFRRVTTGSSWYTKHKL